MQARWAFTVLKRLSAAVIPPVLVFLLLAWGLEKSVAHWKIPKYQVAAPSAVWHAIVHDDDFRPDLLSALWATTKASAVGFGASVIIGALAAVALWSSKWLRRAFYPYTVFFQTVPIIAIAPLLVTWCNEDGIWRVAICSFIVSLFPVISNTLTGLLSTDPALVDLFRLYRAGPISRLLKLRLPWALPDIITGLRVSSGLAVIGAVVGEFLVGDVGDDQGLGVMIVSAGKYGRIDRVFAAVLAASLLGLALFSAVNLLGFILLRRWHASEK